MVCRRRIQGVQLRLPGCFTQGPRLVAPVPGITEPQGGHQITLRRLGTSIDNADPRDHVVRIRLGVLNKDVEVAVLGEYTGVHELELGVIGSAPGALLDELLVGKSPLGILVEHLQVAVRRCGVKIVVVLFDILPVVALFSGETEEPLFQNGVAPIPHGKRQAEVLVAVGDPADPILTPAVGAASRVVVGKVVPCSSAGTVVLSNRSPGTFAEIGSPVLPIRPAFPVRPDPSRFAGRVVPCCHATRVATKNLQDKLVATSFVRHT